MSAGFISKGARVRSGTRTFQPGEWKIMETKGGALRDNILELPTKEPSMVLYQLMVFLIDTGKQMSSITDVMSGVPQGANTPVGTTIAMIEQGMKVIDAVYKRIYLALKTEYGMLYRINRTYLDEANYIAILDDPAASKGDFSGDDFDVIPVGDTRISSQMMRVMKAQALREIAQSTPGANLQEASRLVLRAMDTSQADIDLIIPAQDPNQLLQTIEFLQGQVQTFQQYIQSGQLQMALDENARANHESAALVQKDISVAIKNISEAEAKEIGTQLGIYQAQLKTMEQTFKQQTEVANLERQRTQRAGLPVMGEQSNNGSGTQQPNQGTGII
jgi:hypothetical protein